MRKGERAKAILDYFRENVPVAESELDFQNPYQLVVAVILSAQCTDKRVNMHTPAFFLRFPTPELLAEASFEEVYELIKSISFPNNKAKHLIGMARMLVSDFSSTVPSETDQLEKLPGVGRKTANVVRGNIYHEPSVVVDTHVKRISNKLGFVSEEDPEKIEFALMALLPEDYWILYNIHIIQLGRTICIARSPKWEECFLRDVCPSCGK